MTGPDAAEDWLPVELATWVQSALAEYRRTAEVANAEPANPDAAVALSTAARTLAEVWRTVGQVMPSEQVPMWMVAALRLAEERCADAAAYWNRRAVLVARRPWWISAKRAARLARRR